MADPAAPEPNGRQPYDDHPLAGDPEALPPEIGAPLAGYRGETPPAPAWFAQAIARAPERSLVESLGTRLEVLTWGEVGKPGLLFVHGNSAHADWWSFIAPFFADDYRVAAVSLPGMGGSEWRERYSFKDFAEDLEAAARATGLYAGDLAPVYAGHSFGGAQVFYSALHHPGRMRAAILLDSGGAGPSKASVAARAERRARIRSLPTGDQPHRVYPTLQAALLRFRLMPPQPAGHPFIADYIARRSLKRAPLPDGSGEGWAWRFDPDTWLKLDRSGVPPAGDVALTTPLAHIVGDRSTIAARRGDATGFLPRDIVEVVIPEAHHHLMVDQPLALVAAMRALLAGWPPARAA